jgi:hypothetical protein
VIQAQRQRGLDVEMPDKITVPPRDAEPVKAA